MTASALLRRAVAAASVQETVWHALVSETDLPMAITDTIDEVFHAPTDRDAEALFMERFDALSQSYKRKLLQAAVHSLRVAARAPTLEPAR